MTDRLSPKHIDALFLQIRAINRYLASLKRRLIDLKLLAEELELFEYLTEASEVVDYLSDYLHNRLLRNSCGGWDLPFEKRKRPERRLKRLK